MHERVDDVGGPVSGVVVASGRPRAPQQFVDVPVRVVANSLGERHPFDGEGSDGSG